MNKGLVEEAKSSVKSAISAGKKIFLILINGLFYFIYYILYAYVVAIIPTCEVLGLTSLTVGVKRC